MSVNYNPIGFPMPTETKNGQTRYDVSIQTPMGIINVNTPAGKQLCKESVDYFTKLAMNSVKYQAAKSRMLKKLADKNAK